jgi:transcriptional regulator with XRE-family HTH domain
LYDNRIVTDRFQDKFRRAFNASGMTVAELSRRSGVSYHAIDKLKKRDGATTSAENAKRLAAALGMDTNHPPEADRLVAIFLRLSPENQALLMKLAESLAA